MNVMIESDYITGPYTVTILAGDTVGLLSIAIINDNIMEELETFNLTINVSSLSEGIFSGDPSSALVNILDTDGMSLLCVLTIYLIHSVILVATLSFSQTTYSIDEDIGTVQPTLVLSKLLLTDITVLVNSININTTGNCLYHCCHFIRHLITLDDDYNSGQYNITIPAGMTNASFNISISPDNILEGNELFSLIIDQTSLPTVVVSDNFTLVMIKDDDCKSYKRLYM